VGTFYETQCRTKDHCARIWIVGEGRPVAYYDRKYVVERLMEKVNF